MEGHLNCRALTWCSGDVGGRLCETGGIAQERKDATPEIGTHLLGKSLPRLRRAMAVQRENYLGAGRICQRCDEERWRCANLHEFGPAGGAGLTNLQVPGKRRISAIDDMTACVVEVEAYARPPDVVVGITEAGDQACFGIVEEHDPKRDGVAG